MIDPYILAGVIGFLVTAALHVLALAGTLHVEGSSGVLLTFGSLISCFAVFASSMCTHPDAVVRPGRVSMPPGAISRTAPAWAVAVTRLLLAYCIVVFAYAGYRFHIARHAPPPPTELAFVMFAVTSYLFWSSVTVRLGALRRRASARRR